jgi:hypothetical protein
MKRFLILFPLCLSAAAFAQDEIITRNGEVIKGKVQEITQTEIKYKKTSNPDGPLYTVSKNDVAVVEYKNGTKDVFAAGQQTQQSQQPQDDAVAANTSASSAQTPSSTQVNNYYGSPTPRPNVNVVLGMGMGMGVGYPYWGGGWGWYRPWGWGGYYNRPYYGWGGHYYGHYHHRR